MDVYKLDRADLENLEDYLPEIEGKFNFSLDKDLLNTVHNFDELCELIIASIDLEHIESCTTQQTFYRLRQVIADLNIADKSSITPDTKLEDLFPKENRIKQVKSVENRIGFCLNMLEPSKIVLNSFLTMGIISLIALFIKWEYGILGIFTSITGLYLVYRYGKELQMNSVRELVERITIENYLDLRSNKNSVNKSELKNILLDWFSNNLEIEKEKLAVASFV